MNLIKQFFHKELKHFNKLSPEGQKLIKSIILYNFIVPIFGTFITAFLWRQSKDLILVALYNIMLFAGIPIGFYINGHLLRKFSASLLCVIGLLLMGLSITSIILLPSSQYTTIALFGFIYGISAGVYWANRNLLTLKTTTSENRIYFSGIDASTSTFIGIIVPFLIGIFITLGSQIHLYTPNNAYKLLSIIVLIVIIIIWFVLIDIKDVRTIISEIFLKKSSTSWNKFRLFKIIIGSLGSINNFLPSILILTLIGNEAALGTVQSASAIITAVITYILGKHLKITHRMLLLQIGFIISIIGAGIICLSFTAIGVFIYTISLALTFPLQWIAISSLNYDLIDKENRDQKNHYAYIFDQEIYLNAGRILGIIIFILLIQTYSNTIALRFTPLILALSQILLLLIAKKLENHASPSKTHSSP